MKVKPLVLFLVVLSAALLAACDTEQSKLHDYLYGSYYTTLAKERGDVLTEFVGVIKDYDPDHLPAADFQLTLLPLEEKWIRFASHFEEVTRKDDADLRIKPIRDAYIKVDNLYTFAVTEWFAFADPKLSITARRGHYASYARAFVDATDALTIAHDLVEKAMH